MSDKWDEVLRICMAYLEMDVYDVAESMDHKISDVRRWMSGEAEMPEDVLEWLKDTAHFVVKLRFEETKMACERLGIRVGAP
jgi:hypothetical protein